MSTKSLRSGCILATFLAVATSCSDESDDAELLASVAEQLTIDECTGRNATAVEAGRITGASIVQQAWNSYDDCTDFATFEQIIRDNVALLICDDSTYSTYITCRCLGYKEGIENKLAELRASCDSGTP